MVAPDQDQSGYGAILGAQGDESWQRIDARDMAGSIGTIPWEVVCRVGTRIERVYG